MKRIIPPLIVAAVTFLTFLPILQNGFVDWDDDRDLTGNPYWRGLGWTQLVWMASLHSQHYIPLTWVSFGFDYLVWGLNPVGYHLTNLLLHCASTVIFFFIARRLLALANKETDSTLIGAAFAALLFAIHPLRVESVAWAVERKDCLSGFFILLTVLFYLRRESTWKIVAVYILALASKSIAVVVAPVLLLLDIYVLKRRALWEKAWLALIAVPFAVASSIGESLAIFEHVPFGVRSLTALFAPGWYVLKTLLPVNLSPLYERHPDFYSDPLVIASAIATVGLTVSVVTLRNRWVWACSLYTAVVLGPTLGIVSTSGHEMMTSADRYTYLSFLSWAVLAGAMLSSRLQVCPQTRIEKRRGALPRLTTHAKLSACAAAVVLLALASLTWQQTQIWKNTETFWRQVLRVDPNSSMAHYNFGMFLARHGDSRAAIEHIGEGLRLRPNGDNVSLNRNLIHASWSHWALANLLAGEGNIEESEEHYRQWLYLTQNVKPEGGKTLNRSGTGEASYHALLAKVLSRQGQAEKAKEHFRRAFELNPNLPFCAVNFCDP